jgi:hypothetical protein
MPRNPLVTFRPDPADLARLDDLQARFGLPRADVLRECIRREHAREFPAPVLGYVALDRPGELDEDAECRECGQPLGIPIYVAITGDGAVIGPLCSRCASSE